MEEKSPTPNSPAPLSPNQSSDSEEVSQENPPYNEQQQQQNYPQSAYEQQNITQDGENPQQQPYPMGQERQEDNKTLFFSSLPYDTTEERLAQFINPVAPVQNIRFLKRQDGSSRGKALCEFATIEDAEKVKNNCNGAKFEGRTIIVQNSGSGRHQQQQRYNRRPQRRRYNTPYRDLDAPDDEDDSRRSYDLAPDEEPEKKNDHNRNQNYYHSYNRDRRPYHRRPYNRPYERDMQGGRIQDYRTRPNAPPPQNQQPQQEQQKPQQEMPPMPY